MGNPHPRATSLHRCLQHLRASARGGCRRQSLLALASFFDDRTLIRTLALRWTRSLGQALLTQAGKFWRASIWLRLMGRAFEGWMHAVLHA